MATLDRESARNIARHYRIPLDRDFHALNSDDVEAVLEAAKWCRYRQPRNANGSKARYFHAYLQRAANRKEGR